MAVIIGPDHAEYDLSLGLTDALEQLGRGIDGVLGDDRPDALKHAQHRLVKLGLAGVPPLQRQVQGLQLLVERQRRHGRATGARGPAGWCRTDTVGDGWTTDMGSSEFTSRSSGHGGAGGCERHPRWRPQGKRGRDALERKWRVVPICPSDGQLGRGQRIDRARTSMVRAIVTATAPRPIGAAMARAAGWNRSTLPSAAATRHRAAHRGVCVAVPWSSAGRELGASRYRRRAACSSISRESCGRYGCQCSSTSAAGDGSDLPAESVVMPISRARAAAKMEAMAHHAHSSWSSEQCSRPAWAASSRGTRARAPALVLLAAMAMAVASDDLGWIAFDDYHLARMTGTAALALIPARARRGGQIRRIGGELT